MSVLTSTRPLPAPQPAPAGAHRVPHPVLPVRLAPQSSCGCPTVVVATEQMGFPRSAVPVIGACCWCASCSTSSAHRDPGRGAAHRLPRRRGLRAELIEAPLFSTMLFPVYFGVVVWVALYLRSPQLRELVAASLS